MTAVLEPVGAVASRSIPSLEAHEPPEVRGPRPRRRAAARVERRHRRRARDVRRSARVTCARGDVARREHVGHDPRRDRGDAARRRRDPHPLLDRAAGRLLARRGPPARRRHDGAVRPTTSPASTSTLAGGGHLHAARPLPRLAAPLARGAAPRRDRCSTTSPRYGEPIRYRHAPGPVAARRVPADLRHRAGQRGDAERVAAVHARARRRPRAARRHDRADPAARRRVVARSARDAVPRALPRARRDRRTT